MSSYEQKVQPFKRGKQTIRSHILLQIVIALNLEERDSTAQAIVSPNAKGDAAIARERRKTKLPWLVFAISTCSCVAVAKIMIASIGRRAPPPRRPLNSRHHCSWDSGKLAVTSLIFV